MSRHSTAFSVSPSVSSSSRQANSPFAPTLTHHHYSRKWAVAYVTEACYKYNVRKTTDAFERLIRRAIGAESR